MSKQKIIEKIRSGDTSPPVEKLSGSGGFPEKIIPDNQKMICLKDDLRRTNTELITLQNEGEFGKTLLRCFGDVNAHSALIFPDEIPCGSDLREWFISRETEKDSCEVHLGIDTLHVNTENAVRQLACVDVCVTGCWYLVADGGICVMDSSAGSGRLSSLLPPHHIVVTEKSRIVTHLGEVMKKLSGGEFQARSSLILISGPSRTADIEKELILGVHGPLTLTVILLP